MITETFRLKNGAPELTVEVNPDTGWISIRIRNGNTNDEQSIGLNPDQARFFRRWTFNAIPYPYDIVRNPAP